MAGDINSLNLLVLIISFPGKLYFFPENLKKILGFTSKFRYGLVTLNTGVFLFGLNVLWPIINL